MQAVEVQKVVPQNSVENIEVPPVPVHEQATEDESVSKGWQIRDITAFGDCV